MAITAHCARPDGARPLQMGMHPTEAKELMVALDTDRNGTIDFEEFKAIFEEAAVAAPPSVPCLGHALLHLHTPGCRKGRGSWDAAAAC